MSRNYQKHYFLPQYFPWRSVFNYCWKLCKDVLIQFKDILLKNIYSKFEEVLKTLYIFKAWIFKSCVNLAYYKPLTVGCY